jgi:Sec-independent protein translocase protein TatA
MKKIFLFLLLLPFFVYAQDNLDTSKNKIVVTEEVQDCIQRIHDNPDALKLLMSVIMSDRTKMHQLREELMSDPSFQQMIREFRNEMRGEQNQMDNRNDNMMKDHNMQEENQDMHEEDQNMHEDDMNTIESDTTGVR